MPGGVSAQRKYRYGISGASYQKLLKDQHGKCAACGDGETVLGRSGSVRSLSVDHCHGSGKIRGLLCDRCNNILGRAKDSAGLLRRLASYVEVSETGHTVLDLDRANNYRYRGKGPEINADDLILEMSRSSTQGE
jgi:hypothetical protein